jgi:ADP-heptose:LPS heptosyltransferase
MEQQAIDFTSIHRILVIRLACMGDVLLTTPVLRGLRTAFPKSFITYLTSVAAARDILKNNPDVNECLLRTKTTFEEIPRMPPLDLALDLFGGSTQQMICLLSGARYRVGPGSAPPIGHLRPYNITVPAAAKPRHVIDHFLGFTRAIGLPDPPLKTVLILDEAERDFARTFLERRGINHQDRWIALQPGKNAEEPLWSADKFVALTRGLTRRFGYPIFIFQGPDDRTPIAEEVWKRAGSGVALLPGLPLRHYAAVLEQCTLFVASEGGAGHIAAALGVKTAVIFTAPGISHWFPYTREQGMVALQELPGQNLPVQNVFAAIEELTRE